MINQAVMKDIGPHINYSSWLALCNNGLAGGHGPLRTAVHVSMHKTKGSEIR